MFSSGPAIAQSLPPGPPWPECPNGQLFLRWDDCYGDGGVLNKSFACNTNSGQDVLVASFLLNEEFANAVGAKVYIDVSSSSGAWPSWWAYGSCRSSLTSSISFLPDPDWTVCQSLWPTSSIGTWSLNTGYNGAGTRQLQGLLSFPSGSEVTIPAGAEVFMCRFLLGHAKTVGAGACAGCSEPMCFVISEVELYPPSGGVGRAACGPTTGSPGQMATWQGAAISGISTHNLPGREYFYWLTSDMSCTAPTPAGRPTWGAIKSFYR